jgi:hypothetical protein
MVAKGQRFGVLRGAYFAQGGSVDRQNAARPNGGGASRAISRVSATCTQRDIGSHTDNKQ